MNTPFARGSDPYTAVVARAARGVVESALDATGRPWSRRLSLWLDALVVIEEQRG